ncbi:MAG TPA: hypothetical protein VJ572_07465 [Azonexus sp.]|nr:hypothetical protein [Azonexus sp.]
MIAITCIHVPIWLAGMLTLAFAAAGSGRWRLLRRSVGALLAFNISVSLGYATIALWRGDFSADYLLLVNIRVLLLVFLGFWLVSRVNFLAALAGWPTLSMLATLTVSQVRVYRRVLKEFRLAFRSRNLAPPRLQDHLRHAGAQGGALLDKSLSSASEVALAMRSRGAFDA